MSNGHNGTVFRVLYPKISTGHEKLAPTGRLGRHVFATLPRNDLILSTSNWQATLFDILSPENYPWHDLNRVPVKNVPKIVYTFYSFS